MTTAEPAPRRGHRDGRTYVASYDYDRLNTQQSDVFHLMKDGRWRTLREIADATGHPEPSVSARLRDLRKKRFGGFEVYRIRCGATGLFSYRLMLPPPEAAS